MLLKASFCPFLRAFLQPLIGSAHPSMNSGLIPPSTEPLSCTVSSQSPDWARGSFLLSLPSLLLSTACNPQSTVLAVPLPSQTHSSLHHLRSVLEGHFQPSVAWLVFSSLICLFPVSPVLPRQSQGLSLSPVPAVPPPQISEAPNPICPSRLH